MDNSELSDRLQTTTYSASRGKTRSKAREYLVHRLAYPDDVSEFGQKTKVLKYLFRAPVVSNALASVAMRYLQGKGYDVIMMHENDSIIGHVAFQVHQDNTLHVFSVEVNPEYREKGCATWLLEQTIHEARKRDIERVRIGAGSKEAITRAYNRLGSEEKEHLKVIQEGNNWFRLR